MPAQPSWFPRLPEILTDLRALVDTPYLDRQAFERLFQVRDRRARTLMSRFAGIQIGNAWAVERVRLIEALATLQSGQEFQWEQCRRQCIAEFYQQAKREHPAREVQISVPRTSQSRRFASLPPEIEISPGELHIRFSSFENFLTKLFELSHAVQNDVEIFQEL